MTDFDQKVKEDVVETSEKTLNEENTEVIEENNENSCKDANKELFHDVDDVNVKEPIKDVEKTVEEIKKKIEELSVEEEEKAKAHKEEKLLNIPEFKLNDEQLQRLEAMKKEASEKVSSSLNDLQNKAECFKNKDSEVEVTVECIKENAKKAMEDAKVKVDEFAKSEKVQKALEDINVAAKGVKEEASKKTAELLSEENKEQVKKSLKEAQDFINREGMKVKEGIDNYVNDPEVQARFEERKKQASKSIEDGAAKLKKLLQKK